MFDPLKLARTGLGVMMLITAAGLAGMVQVLPPDAWWALYAALTCRLLLTVAKLPRRK